MFEWKKEYLLIVAAVICLIIFAFRKELKQDKNAKGIVEYLPVIGGLAFGLNTLISVVK
jgi:hypothetical protein